MQQVQPGLPYTEKASSALAVPCHEGGDRMSPLFQTMPQSGSSAETYAEHALTGEGHNPTA